MSEEFKIEIISPDKSIYSGNTEEVVLPCFEGQVTVLKNHIPLITFLRPGVIQILNEKDKKFFVEDGTVEFADINLLILVISTRSPFSRGSGGLRIMVSPASSPLATDMYCPRIVPPIDIILFSQILPLFEMTHNSFSEFESSEFM